MAEPKRIVMPRQDSHSRIRNFAEVTLGYSAAQAMEEASRCYGCKKSRCTEGCPVNVDIPEFVKSVKNGNFENAFYALTESLLFPRITGRVCPQETQCEGSCSVGVKEGCDPLAIGNLERFVGDWAAEKGIVPSYEIVENGKSVAIVGSGPAGMTVAADLRKKGYNVTLYEALHVPGGVLVYGIPEFRMPKTIVRNEIHKLERMGVRIKYNTLVGATESFANLMDENDAIFIGAGAGLPRFLGIPGEELVGVYTANEFLARVNLMGANKFPQYDTPIDVGDRVAVVGGGNVAMDSARVALRLGAEVDIFYRRMRKHMPARKVEIEHALEEGVRFKELRNPKKLIGLKGKLRRVKYSVVKLSNKVDRSGRKIPVETGKTYSAPYDTFIIAIGQNPNPLLPKKTRCLETDEMGYIIVNPETLRVVSVEDCLVFAGGDIIGNQYKGRGGTVIDAMGHGRLAAENIDKLLSRAKWKMEKMVVASR